MPLKPCDVGFSPCLTEAEKIMYCQYVIDSRLSMAARHGEAVKVLLNEASLPVPFIITPELRSFLLEEYTALGWVVEDVGRGNFIFIAGAVLGNDK